MKTTKHKPATALPGIRGDINRLRGGADLKSVAILAGVRPSTVTRIVAGKVRPAPRTLFGLAHALGAEVRMIRGEVRLVRAGAGSPAENYRQRHGIKASTER